MGEQFIEDHETLDGSDGADGESEGIASGDIPLNDAADELTSRPGPSDPPTWAAALLEALMALTESSRQYQARAESQDELILRMQARIEDLQVDQVRQLLGPLVNELASLHTDLGEAAARDYERLGVGRLEKEFAFLSQRVEGAIELLGALSVQAEPGQTFDSRLHSATRQVPTADSSLDGTVAVVQRQGFRFTHESRTAIPARVTVYRFDAALQSGPLEVGTTHRPEPEAPTVEEISYQEQPGASSPVESEEQVDHG